MNIQDDNVIGIVGGMGPEAGLALFKNILKHTKATRDQDHLSVVLMSFPKYITDRSSFLNGSENVNPAYNAARIIEKLEHAGAKVVGLACNTSHTQEIFNVVLQELRRTNSKVKLINMPFETCRHLKDNHPNVCRVGLLATNGTYKSGIYKTLLYQFGYDPILPNPELQENVIHKMIYDPHFGIKANPDFITEEVNALMDDSIRYLKTQKADAVILGCTELSLLAAKVKKETDMIVIDSSEALALSLIREATNRLPDREGSFSNLAANETVALCH
jgi:aspartate racemase